MKTDITNRIRVITNLIGHVAWWLNLAACGLNYSIGHIDHAILNACMVILITVMQKEECE